MSALCFQRDPLAVVSNLSLHERLLDDIGNLTSTEWEEMATLVMLHL